MNSKSFRRLAGKTQVFSLEENSLVHNRLIHTIEVLSVSEIMARLLGLNEDLVKVIAVGHDLGHTSFGHLGERMLSKIIEQEFPGELSFRHEKFSVVITEDIERQGRGLNLSAVVKV
jgi:dGTPase